MADYKELLRRAVDALPENHGAARRAVYEKARAALVGQLRAINPPLAARDITTHRLQLEDCIRQVEQEASEAVIAGMGAQQEALPAPEPKAEAPDRKEEAPAGKAVAAKPVLVASEAAKTQIVRGTIEDIIAAANREGGAEADKGKAEPKSAARSAPIRLASSTPEPEVAAEESDLDEPSARPAERALPSIVSRAEAVKGRSAATAFGRPQEKPYDAPRRGPILEPRRSEAPRLEPAARGGQQVALARQHVAEPESYSEEPQIAAAMSAVREVEVEPQPIDPQGAIDRAIATLDREARGEPAQPIGDIADDEDEAPARGARKGLGGMFAGGVDRNDAVTARPPRPERRNALKSRPEPRRGTARRGREAAGAEAGFPRARAEDDRGGLSALTIFLAVFAVLLVGAGGAGYWAISQGYLDLGSMFRSSGPAVEAAAPATTEPAASVASGTPATGPGNTATAEAPPAPPELRVEERLTPEPALSGSAPLALTPPTQTREAERLAPADVDDAVDAETAVAAIDQGAINGSQSLLLEASDDGTTGAVPFSGTVDWSRGTDEVGEPTLIGKANIPARNLGVDLLIRKNSDPSLPASHLMEVNFRVSDSFIGGSVAGLPGVLMKNEELVQGSPLVGASARVVGNSFLFALSAAPDDATANGSLLTSRKWMDLAVIYATGKRAIITLEKDEAATRLFSEVFADWSGTASLE